MSTSTEPHPTTVPSTNVLIVDDHDLVAMSLALCLRSEGLHAQRHAARSRDGVLAAVATLVPGVVLLDLDLGRGPDGAMIDGTTLVAHLCRTGWRVIVLSSTEDEPSIGRALDAGALACVPKTAALPVLIAAIRRAAQGVEVMRPERRGYLIAQYRRQQEQARAVEQLLDRLTERERAVLERLARGWRTRSIAAEFGVSLATTRVQIRAVLHKLGVSGQLEAVALVNEHRRAVHEVQQLPHVYGERPRTASITDPAMFVELLNESSLGSAQARADRNRGIEMQTSARTVDATVVKAELSAAARFAEQGGEDSARAEYCSVLSVPTNDEI